MLMSSINNKRRRVGTTRYQQNPGASVSNSGGSRPATGSSSTRGSNTGYYNRQNDIDSSFSDLLAKITNQGNSGNSILDLLNALGIDQNKGLTGSQRDDWNKQLLDTLLNYALTQENRGYNESMRDEQRIYDSPTNQLARLMGAGVSRDAAIQLLGGGSQPIQSDAASAAEGIAPSESKLNGINAALAPIQTAFDAISAVGGLVSLGFSVPQAIQQTKFLKNQNILTQKELKSYDAASSAFNVLQALGAPKEAFGSAGDAMKYINNAAKNGNNLATQFMQSDGYKTLSNEGYYTSRALSQLYQNERSAESYGQFIQQQYAQNEFLQLSGRSIVTQMAKMNQEIENYKVSEEYTRAQTSLVEYSKKCLENQAVLFEKQGKLADAQAVREKASKLQIDEDTRSLKLANNIEDLAQNTYQYDQNGDLKSGLDIMSSERRMSAYMNMRRLVSMNDNDLIDKEVKSLGANYEQLNDLYTLMGVYHSGALEKLSQDEDLADLMYCCDLFSQSQGWAYLNAMIQAQPGAKKFLIGSGQGVESIVTGKSFYETVQRR